MPSYLLEMLVVDLVNFYKVFFSTQGIMSVLFSTSRFFFSLYYGDSLSHKICEELKSFAVHSIYQVACIILTYVVGGLKYH